jgi:anti-anti-sigma factor
MMPREVDVQIQERTVEGVTVLEVDGSLMAHEQTGALKTAVERALGRGAADIVLDLTAVGYVGSTRLGELIAAHVTVSRGGGRLKLAAVPPRVAELLRIAGLDHVFEQFQTVERAARDAQEP